MLNTIINILLVMALFGHLLIAFGHLAVLDNLAKEFTKTKEYLQVLQDRINKLNNQ